MTEQQHPITPPPELVEQWDEQWHDAMDTAWEQYIATKAAQWGYEQRGADLQKARDEELGRRFETWWYDEGSGMSPRADEDCEKLVHRVSRIAWHNGVYCALERLQELEGKGDD